MKKLTSIAVIPLFAGFLWAQSDQSTKTQTETRSTTTTAESSNNDWNGTLVDAGCRTTQTAHRESTYTSHPDETTTKTTTTKTNTYNTECPVTTTTTTFGLMTPEGQYVTFDEPSNTKIIEVVKNNKKWSKSLANREPVKVRVHGNKKGDVVVVESIQ
jgi:hypothetical protein